MLLLLASHLSKTFLAVRTSLDMFADPSVFIKKKKKAHTHTQKSHKNHLGKIQQHCCFCGLRLRHR